MRAISGLENVEHLVVLRPFKQALELRSDSLNLWFEQVEKEDVMFLESCRLYFQGCWCDSLFFDMQIPTSTELSGRAGDCG